MAVRTPKELQKLLNQVPRLVDALSEEAALRAMDEVKRRMTRRIFRNNEGTEGQKIGKYSRKPILVGAKTFKDKPGGTRAINQIFGSKKKIRAQKWRRVRGNNLVLLDGGYKQVRDLMGLPTGRVDLQVTGDLMRSLQITARGGEVILGIVGEENRLKAVGNSERFKKDIFPPSNDELAAFIETYQDHIFEKIGNLLR